MDMSPPPDVPYVIQRFVSDEKKWHSEIKKIKNSEDLLVALEGLVKKNDLKKHPKVTILAGRTVAELNMRKLDEVNTQKLRALAAKIQERARVCLVQRENAVEMVGLRGKSLRHARKPYHKNVHVYGLDLREIYEAWEQFASSEDFEAYLNKWVPEGEFRDLVAREVAHLSKERAKKYEVTFHDGRLMQEGHVIADGEYMFVLDLEGKKLFVGKKIKGRFHHSSFVSGNPVQCAGKIFLKDGFIQRCILESGHYKPTTEHGKQFHEFLKDPDRMGEKADQITIEPHVHRKGRKKRTRR